MSQIFWDNRGQLPRRFWANFLVISEKHTHTHVRPESSNSARLTRVFFYCLSTEILVLDRMSAFGWKTAADGLQCASKRESLIDREGRKIERGGVRESVAGEKSAVPALLAKYVSLTSGLRESHWGRPPTSDRLSFSLSVSLFLCLSHSLCHYFSTLL